MTTTSNLTIRIVALMVAAIAALGAALLLSPGLTADASAQTAARGQYQPPEGDAGPAGGDAADNGSGALPGAGAGGEGPSGEAGSGELPFTGYPMTPLLLLLLVLLAIGLTLRLYLAARDRLRARASTLRTP